MRFTLGQVMKGVAFAAVACAILGPFWRQADGPKPALLLSMVVGPLAIPPAWVLLGLAILRRGAAKQRGILGLLALWFTAGFAWFALLMLILTLLSPSARSVFALFFLVGGGAYLFAVILISHERNRARRETAERLTDSPGVDSSRLGLSQTLPASAQRHAHP